MERETAELKLTHWSLRASCKQHCKYVARYASDLCVCLCVCVQPALCLSQLLSPLIQHLLWPQRVRPAWEYEVWGSTVAYSGGAKGRKHLTHTHTRTHTTSTKTQPASTTSVWKNQGLYCGRGKEQFVKELLYRHVCSEFVSGHFRQKCSAQSWLLKHVEDSYLLNCKYALCLWFGKGKFFSSCLCL